MATQTHYFGKKIEDAVALFWLGYSEADFQQIAGSLKSGELPSNWLCYHTEQYTKAQFNELRQRPYIVFTHPVYGTTYASAVEELIREKILPSTFRLGQGRK